MGCTVGDEGLKCFALCSRIIYTALQQFECVCIRIILLGLAEGVTQENCNCKVRNAAKGVGTDFFRKELKAHCVKAVRKLYVSQLVCKNCGKFRFAFKCFHEPASNKYHSAGQGKCVGFRAFVNVYPVVK